MSRELKIAPKEFGKNTPSTTMTSTNHGTSQLTALQLAYRNQKDSVFFGKLPPEICNRIYAHLLVLNDAIVVEINTWIIAPDWMSWGLGCIPNQHCHVSVGYQGPFVGDNREPLLDAAMARTCRLSVYEAYPILYGQNVFSFHDSGDMHKFERAGTLVDLT